MPQYCPTANFVQICCYLQVTHVLAKADALFIIVSTWLISQNLSTRVQKTPRKFKKKPKDQSHEVFLRFTAPVMTNRFHKVSQYIVKFIQKSCLLIVAPSDHFKSLEQWIFKVVEFHDKKNSLVTVLSAVHVLLTRILSRF